MSPSNACAPVCLDVGSPAQVSRQQEEEDLDVITLAFVMQESLASDQQRSGSVKLLSPPNFAHAHQQGDDAGQAPCLFCQRPRLRIPLLLCMCLCATGQLHAVCPRPGGDADHKVQAEMHIIQETEASELLLPKRETSADAIGR